MVLPLNRAWRIAFYSHDTMGLGHVRRNLLIAQALSERLSPSILLISGIREAASFAMPTGVDCLTLPALRKDPDGRYQTRHLGLHLQETVELRQHVIAAALGSFAPDVFVVDNVPRGAVRELDLVLAQLRRAGSCHCILGLRDVLDDPLSVREEWRRARNEEAIRQYYSAIWIYGDPNVYDLARSCDFAPDVAAKVTYTGYLDQSTRLHPEQLDPVATKNHYDLPAGSLVLCLVGGGQDGPEVAEAFADAWLPEGATGVVVTGPFMPVDVQRRLSDRAAANPRLRVLRFVPDTGLLLAAADAVVAMGGYNTVGEVLAYEKPALIVPRVSPRREQWVRATRLRDLGLVDVLPPDELSAEALSDWLGRQITTGRRTSHARERVDLSGLVRIPRMVGELLREHRPRYEYNSNGHAIYAAV